MHSAPHIDTIDDFSSSMNKSDLNSDLFLQQPYEIIRKVLAFLPKSVIYGVFIKIPGLREDLIKTYYSSIDFILQSKISKDINRLWIHGSRSFRLIGFEKISTFLKENHDVLPDTACIYALGYEDFEALLSRHGDFFRLVPNLHVKFSSHSNSFDLKYFELLGALPNLKSLRLRSGTPKTLFPGTPLARMSNLESLYVSSYPKENWTGAALPQNLRVFEVDYGNLSTLDIPPRVEIIRWSNCPDVISLKEVRFPSTLTNLSLEYIPMDVLVVSDLPRTLKRLKISNCAFNQLLKGDRRVGWPPKLESLDMSSNLIDDESLEQMGKLPHGLRVLNLARNDFLDFFLLKNLPSTLKVLDLSGNRIDLLSEIDYHQATIFYEFPEGLETLNLSDCGDLNLFAELISNDARATFPNSLRELIFDNCFELDVSMISFPCSLERLSLKNVGITNLNYYEVCPWGEGYGRPPLIKVETLWRSLENLKTLNLSSNRIQSLEGWSPPPNLVSLDLSRNELETLSSTWPLFNKSQVEKLQCLQDLNLAKNNICSIDPAIQLAPELTTLNLNNNCMTQFSFTRGIVGARSLTILSLRANRISKFKAIESKLAAALKAFDLGGQKTDNKSVDELYKSLKKIGLVPSTRAESLSQMHFLIPA